MELLKVGKEKRALKLLKVKLGARGCARTLLGPVTPPQHTTMLSIRFCSLLLTRCIGRGAALGELCAAVRAAVSRAIAGALISEAVAVAAAAVATLVSCGATDIATAPKTLEAFSLPLLLLRSSLLLATFLSRSTWPAGVPLFRC